ncbi:MAG: HEPN domain-containing protein [Candidatus Micrarchaeia archaeon]
MRKEAENWLKQAESDFKNAKFLVSKKAYDLVAFLSHQVAEKSLKAYIIEKKRELPFKGHNLKEYGEDAECPMEISIFLRDLTPHYIVSRYPDASGGVPAELYTEENARLLLEKAGKVLEWAKKSLKVS